jgi:hypothetical protein
VHLDRIFQLAILPTITDTMRQRETQHTLENEMKTTVAYQAPVKIGNEKYIVGEIYRDNGSFVRYIIHWGNNPEESIRALNGL